MNPAKRWTKTVMRPAFCSPGTCKHEVFFGSAYRQKSKRLGLWVCICHGKCHLWGEEAVHNNRETDLYLKEQGQLAAMERYGWDEEKFRAEFGRSYLED